MLSSPVYAASKAALISLAIQSRIPLGRFGTPDQVASAVPFLASPEAAFIVGTELVVDGGMIGL